MSSHKPECDAKWGYSQDHCICQWIELAEQRIIKLLEEAKTWLEDYHVDELINQIKGENK